MSIDIYERPLSSDVLIEIWKHVSVKDLSNLVNSCQTLYHLRYEYIPEVLWMYVHMNTLVVIKLCYKMFCF